MCDWSKPKPQPKIEAEAGHKWILCNKCGGNGLYVQAIINGQPYSNTGLQCWSCGGTGWVTRKIARRKRCPECGFLCECPGGVFEPHSYYQVVDGNAVLKQCK